MLIPALSLNQITIAQENLDKLIGQNRMGQLIVKAPKGTKVEVEQLQHEFWFGCAISNSIFDGSATEENVKQYREKFLQNFNSAVTENAMKWASMEPGQGNVNYKVVDNILAWTEENRIPLRGHNLYWGIEQFVQPWVKALDNEQLKKVLENRGETVAARYKRRFAEYDLNNEMVHGNYYEDRLGPEITKWMAEWVHRGDPDAKLFLNDYDILTGVKLDAYLAQIRKFQNEGVPIAGIGVQGHLHAETFDRAQLKRALDSLATFKLPIRVTEFNIPGQRSKYYNDRNLKMTPEEAKINAKELVDYYTICFAHPAVEGIIMWGFWEGANWIPVSSLYNRDWSINETGKAYQELIFKKWWTKTSGKADDKGNFSTKAFFGKYKITAGGQSKIVSLSKNEGQASVEFP
jgi:GH35 family endo-1,4-beta-xylanase